MKRAVEICPTLTGGKGPEALDVITHSVGLRPLREEGTRLEKENIDGLWVVHNYAHGGFGCKRRTPCNFLAESLVQINARTAVL